MNAQRQPMLVPELLGTDLWRDLSRRAGADRTLDLDLLRALDAGGSLIGYRLRHGRGDTARLSRLYLSREDAIDAWLDRSIEWEI